MKTMFFPNEQEVMKNELRYAICDTDFEDTEDTEDTEESIYARAELEALVDMLAKSNGLNKSDTEADVRYYTQFVADEDEDVDKAYDDAEMELGIRTEEQRNLFVDLVQALLAKVDF